MIGVPEGFAPDLPPRVRQIVDVAREMLEEMGWDAVSMRPLAERMGIRAPSIYKHFTNRDAIKSALVAIGLVEMGEALHPVVDRRGGVGELLEAYRSVGKAAPNLYRLSTAGPLDRDGLPDGLEEWSGSPFYLVTGDPYVAQALWSFAHGLLILELDERHTPGSDLDRTWADGARCFTPRTD